MRRAADILVVLLICALLLLLIFKVLFVPFPVETPRISELEDGDVLLIDRFSKYLSNYSLGDLVKAELPAGDGVYRVAALGGYAYTVKDGAAYLNGALIDESAYSSGWPEGIELYAEINEDQLLLLPDDREGITELQGFILLYNDVYGEVRFRVYPWNRLSLFR